MVLDSELLTGTLGFISLAMAIVGIAVKASNNQVKSNEEIKYTKQQVSSLETRVDKLENNIYNELKELQHSIFKMNENIAVLLDNKKNY
jgi:uncharacterized protein Yka (UPF0111/DUF47 family)